MKKGDWIKLKGLTGHGKNRVREHGEDWKIEDIRESKIMIKSKHETFKVGSGSGSISFMVPDCRWIKLPVDPNFEIVKEEIE